MASEIVLPGALTDAPAAGSPPGPALPWWRQLKLVRKDFLGYLAACAERYGAIFCIRPTPGTRMFVVNTPALARAVTVDRAAEFRKSHQTHFMVGKFLGRGLVLSEGDRHAAQRRLLKPCFGPRGMSLICQAAATRAKHLAAQIGPGVMLDVEPAMTQLSMGVIQEFLLGRGPSRSVHSDEGAFRTLAEAIGGRFKSLPLPAWIPTARNLKERQAVREASRLIEKLLDQAPPDGTSVLSVLRRAFEQGELSATDVRDQIITLLFAGHETVAKTLTWSLYLLARHPEAQAKLYAELQSLASDGGLSPANLARARYLTAVIKESMRLYPPAWVFDRSPTAPLELGGIAMNPKDVIYVSPYLLHRNAEVFPAPERFDPERFTGGKDPGTDGGYLPFGAGPRACIGQIPAFLETAVVLGTLLTTHHVQITDERDIRPKPDATLTPDGPVLLAFVGR